METPLWVWLIVVYLVIDALICLWRIQENKTECFFAAFTVNLLWIIFLLIKITKKIVEWVKFYIEELSEEIKNI